MLRPLGCALVYCSLAGLIAANSFAQESLPRADEAEAKIEAALGQPAKLDFDNWPLSEVVAQIVEQHKIFIQLDMKALTDSGLGSDTPIKAHLEGLSLRSALKVVFGQIDLTYVIRDEVLLITSKTEAENMLTSRIYPVRDLVGGESGFRPAIARGEDRQEQFGELLNVITKTVAPTTWDDVGGPGSAKQFPNSRALVFSQTGEIHEEITALLAALRRTRLKQQIAARALAQGKEPLRAPAGQVQVRIYRLGFRPELMDLGIFAMPDAELAAGTNYQGAQPQYVKSGDASAESAALAQKTALTEDGEEFEEWAEGIAEILREIIAPESWQPHGIGFVRSAAGSLVIRQTETNHREIALFLDEILPKFWTTREIANETSAPLAVSGPQADWPQEAEPQPGAVEAAIEKALDAKVDLSFVDTPLSDVVKAIKQQVQLDIQLDEMALLDAGLASDLPVTQSLPGLSLRAALHLLLNQMDLTYVIRNEVLMITSKTEAENMLTTKVYPVFDLVVRPAGAPQRGRAVDYQTLQDALSANIAPTTWDEVGGHGVLTPFINAGALVISQTTEVHEEIARYLRALRDASAGEK